MKKLWRACSKNIILAILLAMGLAGGFLLWKQAQNRGFFTPAHTTPPKPVLTPPGASDFLPIEKGDTVVLLRANLEQVVKASGSLQSIAEHEVNTTLTATVQTVYAKVGDRVSTGELLCQLDTTAIDLQIEDVQKKITRAEAGDALKLGQAQRKLSQLQQQSQSDETRRAAEEQDALLQLNQAKEKMATETADKQVSDEDVQLANTSFNEAHNRLMATPEKLEDGSPNPLYAQRQEEVNMAQMLVDAAFSQYNQAWQAVYHETLANCRPAEAAKYEDTLLRWETAMQNHQLAIRAAAEAVDICRAADSAAESRSKLEKFLQEQQQARITSPASGTVIEVGIRAGGKTSSSSHPLFVIQSEETLKAEVDIAEADAVLLKPGMPVTVTCHALPKEECPGVLAELSPLAREGTFTGTVLLNSKPNLLAAGMTADIHIVIGVRHDVFAVPHSAIALTQEHTPVVYAKISGEQTPIAIPVQVGAKGNRQTEIEGEGLYPGIAILLHPPPE